MSQLVSVAGHQKKSLIGFPRSGSFLIKGQAKLYLLNDWATGHSLSQNHSEVFLVVVTGFCGFSSFY